MNTGQLNIILDKIRDGTLVGAVRELVEQNSTRDLTMEHVNVILSVDGECMLNLLPRYVEDDGFSCYQLAPAEKLKAMSDDEISALLFEGAALLCNMQGRQPCSLDDDKRYHKLGETK